MIEDVIARIDQAVGCQLCGKPLRDNGPSPDFCKESCQEGWYAKRASRRPEAAVPSYVGLDRGEHAVGEQVAEFAEQTLGVRLDSWQRWFLSRWFGRHR